MRRPKNIAQFSCERCGTAFSAYALKQPKPRWCSATCGARAAEARDPDRALRYRRTSYKRNLQKRLAYNRAWRKKNPEKARAAADRWASKNAESVAERRAGYRVALHKRPGWYDSKAVARFYQLAKRLTIETGIQHHVDHIIPLNGKTVCGLHVQNNLQVLPALDNLVKGNSFNPDHVAVPV